MVEMTRNICSMSVLSEWQRTGRTYCVKHGMEDFLRAMQSHVHSRQRNHPRARED
jgi:hypothetical protein